MESKIYEGLSKKIVLALATFAAGSTLPACPGLGGNVYETGLGPYVACYVPSQTSIGGLVPVYNEDTCSRFTDVIEVP